MSGSPLVVQDRVIVTPGGEPGRAIMAFACRDGGLAWSSGDDPAAYASPALVRLAGETQLLSFNGAGLRGSALTDGRPLWLFPWITQGERQRVNVAQPIVVTRTETSAPQEGFVLVSSGYEMGTALLRVSVDQGNWQVAEVWHSRALKSKMSNFVVRDGYIYGFDSGILTCLDLRDGQRMWKRGRYGHGQLLLVNDLLLIQAETGEVVLVAATPEEHREMASLTALSGKTWNHAALAGNILVVRSDREAAAYELPEQDPAQPSGLSVDSIAQLVEQSPTADSQLLCGLSTVALALVQSCHDCGALDLCQTLVIGSGIGHAAGQRGDFRRQVFRHNDIAATQQTSTLQRIAELSHVAWPAIAEQALRGLG